MDSSIYYWPIKFSDMDFQVKISERSNNSRDRNETGWIMHWHDQLELQYVRTGGICINCNGKKNWVYSNDIVFVNWCDLHHSMDFIDNTTYYVIQIDVFDLIDYKNDFTSRQLLDNFLVQSHNFESFFYNNTKLCSLLDEMISEYNSKEYGYQIIIKSIVLKLLGLMVRKYFNYGDTNVCDSSISYTREVLYYIVHNYNHAINLDSLSRHIGVSKNYMCNTFKKHTGCTIISYLNKIRCYKAISLIENGVSITQTAIEVGYDDYNYFSRIFKQIIGESPSKIRHKPVDH